ncbi:MAG: tetratricopeptide repeat protein [Planctomycetes bacterium]|nr:tetratricopeptide repeat protein [Planctomycetota bacterium]
MYRSMWMAAVCLVGGAVPAPAQLFLGLPPEGYKQDPKVLEAREKQLRTALAEPGYHLSERKQQTWELIQTLAMAGKNREAIEVLGALVEQARSLGRYDGDMRYTRDLEDLAELYHRAGDHAKAVAIRVERVANYTEHFGPKNGITGHARSQLVKAYMRAKDYEKAITEWEKILAELPEDSPGRNAIQMEVLEAYVATKNFEKLDKLVEAYLAQAKNTPQGDVGMRVFLAGIYTKGGAADRGRALLEGELTELRKSKGQDSPEVIAKTEQLAQVCLAYGQQEIGFELYRDAIKLAEKKHGADHEEPLKLRNNFAWLFYNQRKLDKAMELYAELVPTIKAKLGAGHPLALTTAANLALILEDKGKFVEAEPIRKEVADETAKASKDPQAANVVAARALLGANLLQQSKWADAEKIFVEVLEIRKKNEPTAWTTFNAASMLGDALMNQKKYKEAEPLLLEGYQGLQKSISQIPAASYSRYYDSIRRLVKLYEQTDRQTEADKLRRFVPMTPR